MARKPFLQIREAESNAHATIKNAQEESEQIIKRAEEENADAFTRFSETCKQRVSERRRQVESDARKNSEEVSKETAELCVALKEKLSMQKAKAIETVIQTIITQQ